MEARGVGGWKAGIINVDKVQMIVAVVGSPFYPPLLLWQRFLAFLHTSFFRRSE